MRRLLLTSWLAIVVVGLMVSPLALAQSDEDSSGPVATIPLNGSAPEASLSDVAIDGVPALPGESVTISGQLGGISGVSIGRIVGEDGVSLGAALIDASGSFDATIVVPEDATPGQFTLLLVVPGAEPLTIGSATIAALSPASAPTNPTTNPPTTEPAEIAPEPQEAVSPPTAAPVSSDQTSLALLIAIVAIAVILTLYFGMRYLRSLASEAPWPPKRDMQAKSIMVPPPTPTRTDSAVRLGTSSSETGAASPRLTEGQAAARRTPPKPAPRLADRGSESTKHGDEDATSDLHFVVDLDKADAPAEVVPAFPDHTRSPQVKPSRAPHPPRLTNIAPAPPLEAPRVDRTSVARPAVSPVEAPRVDRSTSAPVVVPPEISQTDVAATVAKPRRRLLGFKRAHAHQFTETVIAGNILRRVCASCGQVSIGLNPGGPGDA